ncbi:hypothetical protein PLESTB_001522000 [Pleodorina starrii]|uniref:Scytovirin-like domain-containing protein n=1 Tax=Pleodorina starrii TaxID=330485 RepID=A0A9W6F7Z2_9CHLO|nr:hypothetical protein PLESTB_001522000 [Pleodorina starrii]
MAIKKAGLCCDTEDYRWDESTNPLGPSRCRSSSNNCDCDGLRRCSRWGYCQGIARRASKQDAALSTPPPLPPGAPGTTGGLSVPLAPGQQAGSSQELGLSGSSSGSGSGSGSVKRGIGSGGVRTWIVIPIIIFGIVFGILAISLAFCACQYCTRQRPPQVPDCQRNSSTVFIGPDQRATKRRKGIPEDQPSPPPLAAPIAAAGDPSATPHVACNSATPEVMVSCDDSISLYGGSRRTGRK